MQEVGKGRTFTGTKPMFVTFVKLSMPFPKCFRGPKVRKVKNTSNRVHVCGSVLCQARVPKN